ncbi:MAG: phosphoenolpyruvate synthase, partial [Gemmatimonadaceae bacterium]|nr:phosphoenolpyruvate synthase [Gemmatimonadaceae bacterium]
VSAVYGLGELLVSGDADADTIRVHFDGAGAASASTQLAAKEQALLRKPGPDGGTERVDVGPGLVNAPAVSEAQAIEIATVARTLQQALGVPQDIEWALGAPGGDHAVGGPRANDVLYILQARPVTATGASRTGERRIWDNSNIVESYSGVTTPLTFSFARGVYEQVYRQFCEVLGVGDRTIDAHADVFATMLGLIRGRVYYNLLNWYRVLALLPGYAVNREFMERMMGVRERLVDPPPPPGAGARSRDAVRLLRSATRLWREHRRLGDENREFFARVNRSLAPIDGVDLDPWPADDLVALYRRLDRELLLHWRAPLVNDFFAMIWFGVLSRLVEQWLPDAEPTLVNDLLVGEGGIISTEPARRIMGLAALAAADQALRHGFESEPDDDALLRNIRTDPRHQAFARALDEYLAVFGDRCIGELKLETVTPNEDPAFVIRMTRAYVMQQQTDAARGTGSEASVRGAAEEYARTRLGAPRRSAFFMVARHARDRVRDRENLRFERTRVFGAVRRIFRGLGHRLHEAGRLAEPRDVYYLTVEEIFAAMNGTGITHDLTGVARARREQFARYDAEPAPPERFETWGMPDVPPRSATSTTTSVEGDLAGLGCCPGVVRGPVRVVRDPSAAGNLHGHILVAERTDPGWTLLFPTASGLLVQRGSLLSHSAIVAREIGLPCVVAIPNLMDSLVSGEWVEMDGATGVVRRIPSPDQQEATP